MKRHILEQIEEAVQLEEDGYNFYSDLGRKSRGLVRDMFTALAGDEARHKTTFTMMRETFKRKAKFKDEGDVTVRRLPVFKDVLREFEAQKRYERTAIDASFGQTTVADTLNIAMAAEQKSIAHYSRLLEHARDIDLVVTLERIWSEEVVHLRLLEAQRDHLKEHGFWFHPKEFFEFRKMTEVELREFLKSEGYDVPSPVVRNDIEWDVNG